jgi:3-oxoacid CoA-transferase
MRYSQKKQQQPSTSKLFSSADEAVADIKSGSTVLSSGFGLNGVAGSLFSFWCPFLPPIQRRRLTVGDLTTETLIAAMHRRGPEALHSLTAVSNNAGIEGKGGLAILTKAGQVNRLILSFLGNNKALERKYLTGELAVELCPQGTLAERIRAGGAGIPAFFTPTAARELRPWNQET